MFDSARVLLKMYNFTLRELTNGIQFLKEILLNVLTRFRLKEKDIPDI